MKNINAPQFIPAKFSPDDCMPAVSASFTPEPAGVPQSNTPAWTGGMTDLYPEIYRQLFPLVADAAERMITDGYSPSQESISETVDSIIKSSGLWYEDDDFDMESHIIPASQGFGRQPQHRGRRGHHNRNTLRDIVRILLLKELIEGQRRSPINYRY